MPRKDLESYSMKVSYRKHPGTIMWYLHRVSGVVIGLFLVLHIVGASGTCSFLTGMTASKYFMTGIAVLFVLHAMNGVRIVLMEFACAAERSKFIPYIVGTCVAVALVGGLFAFKILGVAS